MKITPILSRFQKKKLDKSAVKKLRYRTKKKNLHPWGGGGNYPLHPALPLQNILKGWFQFSLMQQWNDSELSTFVQLMFLCSFIFHNIKSHHHNKQFSSSTIV
jgi:hypothetical protein